MTYKPQKLIEFVRDGLVEQEHYGFLLKISEDKNILRIGDDDNYPYYLRSCAKPLQASLIVDLNLDEYFNMTEKEVAICCASHAGEEIHTKTVKDFLNRMGLNESFLKCCLQVPLSKVEQKRLTLNGEEASALHNNCSGKHSMMLAACVKEGFSTDDYFKINHPLQFLIKKKIYELCEIKGEYPSTKDGCGVPIYSMPLENMLRGYLNLFLNSKYKKIKDAFLNNPYLIGGENRLDTAIMTASDNLIAKVGAGGLCIVVNLQKKEALLVKIMDCDMKARALVLIEALRQLCWLDENSFKNELLQAQNQIDILTKHGEKIGQAEFRFQMPA